MYGMEYDDRKLYHISLSINNQTNSMGGRPIYGQFANTNTLFSYDYKPP